MKLCEQVISVLMLAVLASCSQRQTELAASASADEFDGRWSGTWSWDPGKRTVVEISGGQVKVTGLPLESGPKDKMVVLSAAGEARFQAAYGAKSAPCVLLYFASPKDVVALFIVSDKQHLLYDVNLPRDQRIILEKMRL